MNRFAALKHLLPFCRPYAGRFLLAFLFLCIAAAATLSVPYAFKNLIDFGFSKAQGGNAQAINTYFLGLFGIAVILAVFTAARFYMVSWLGERVTADLRRAVYASMLRQSPQFFETTQTGEVLSRLTTDTTLVQTVVGTSISMGLRNLFLFVGGLAMLVITNPHATLIILLIIALVVIPIVLFGRRVRKLSRASQDRIADTSSTASEVLNAMPIVQAFTNEKLEDQRYSLAVNNAFDTAILRNKMRSILTAIVITIVFGGAVYGLWLGARAVNEGSMTAGLLSQSILYVAIVAGSVAALSEVIGDILRAAGATERLLELYTAEPHIKEIGEQSNTHNRMKRDVASNKAIASAISLEDVLFHYPSRPATAALDHVSLTIQPGQTVAIVGPSGAGKTTLFQLLLRFYDPQQGRVLINGQDIRELPLHTLREQIAIVPQDTVVFSANAMENIRYGRPTASDAEVMAAAQAAQADGFISALPEGYHTFLGERGVRLSGGQKQRIAIARAILKDAPLLLLDEATSALDTESEQAVQKAIESAIGLTSNINLTAQPAASNRTQNTATTTTQRTTLIIAHRLSTVQSADWIYVLDGGQIVESGTPKQLLNEGGLYARLAQMQVQA